MEFSFILKMVISLIVFGVFIGIAFLFKKFGYNYLIQLTKKSKWRADDVIIPALKKHIFFWIVLLGIYFSTLGLFSSQILSNIHKTITVLFIISLTFGISKIISDLIKIYSDRLQTTVAMSGLTQSISRTIVFIIGALMILNSLGISITPLLTTLGIGGLAVALALQDTLSNFFAGFHIILAKQIRIGDYIKLEGGEEGYVVDINWRTTKIRMLPNNIVLIPNSKLAQSIITNYYLPEKEMAVLVQVGVHYDSDLEEVEKITIEVAKEVMKEVVGGVAGFEPFIRYHTFGDFSINFTVILRAKEFVDQYMVKHEFIKRLHRKFKEKNIVIPFPITALNVTQEEAYKFLEKDK
jgi:small-conductance mechanosensitive channel